MFLRILPGWLYASLPVLYILAGIVVLLLAGNWLAHASGALLVISGLLVSLMRRSHKAAARARSARRTRTALPESAGRLDEAARAHWDDSLVCGNRVIDLQHRELVSRANELLLALGGQRSRADIELMLDELIEKLEEHFRTEEGIAEAAGHGDLEAHRQVHRTLLTKAGCLLEEFQEGRRIGTELSRFIAEDLLAGHVAGEREVFAGG